MRLQSLRTRTSRMAPVMKCFNWTAWLNYLNAATRPRKGRQQSAGNARSFWKCHDLRGSVESLEARTLLTVDPITLADPSVWGDSGFGADTYSNPWASDSPSISADGQIIVFESQANNLVPNDFNSLPDIFVYNRGTGQVSLVSENAQGTGSGNRASTDAHVTPDGHFVVFYSKATNLDANIDVSIGFAEHPEVFVRDLITGVTHLVSVNMTGDNGATNGPTTGVPSISDDGRFVVFQSGATNLVPNNSNGHVDVYLRDLLNNTTTLVNHTPSGGSANESGEQAVISGNGQFVAFYSTADDLVPTDANTAGDLFLFNRVTGNVKLITENITHDGSANSGGQTLSPQSISADGRFVAFISSATNLAANSSGFTNAAFLRDTQTDTTYVLSPNKLGNGTVSAINVVITPNGHFVGLLTNASTLASDVAQDTNGNYDVFLADIRDLDHISRRMVSVNTAGTNGGNADSGNGDNLGGFTFANGYPQITADGRYVAFGSLATNLVTGITDENTPNLRRDVFLRDMQSNVTQVISLAPDGLHTGNSGSYLPTISSDARVIAFVSNATDLAPGNVDGNGQKDVFVRDLSVQFTELVSAHSPFMPDEVLIPQGVTLSLDDVTPDGRYVAFVTNSAYLTPEISSSQFSYHAYVRDRLTGVVEQVSVAANGTDAGTTSGVVRISADGRFVAFRSSVNSAAFDPGTVDTNGGADLFVRDRLTGVTTLVSAIPGGNTTSSSSVRSELAISPDGRYIVYTSVATDLVSGVASAGEYDLYVWDRVTGTTRMVDVNAAGTAAGNTGSVSSHNLYWPSFSADGSTLVFTTNSSDLVAGVTDTNGTDDVFVYKLSDGTKQLVSSSTTANLTGNFGSGRGSGGGLDQGHGRPTISADGRYVAFGSDASNLTVPAGNGTQVYRRDLLSGTTDLVSINSTGLAGGNLGSIAPFISADGQKVLFQSSSTNLPSLSTNSQIQVFLRDFSGQTPTTTIVSINSSGTAGGNNTSLIQPDYPTGTRFTADGRYVIFLSRSTDLVSGYVDGSTFGYDLYLRDLQTGRTSLVSYNYSGTASVDKGVSDGIAGHGSSYFLAATGPTVVFDTKSSDMIPGDRNNSPDLFAFTYQGDGRISGTLFEDTDGDGSKDGNEDGIPFRTVFLDANNNRRFDAGEISVQTDLSGNYVFTGLAAGTYSVSTVIDDGFVRTVPAGIAATYSATLATDTSSVTGLSFGALPAVADLNVSLVTVDPTAKTGQNVEVSWIVRNVGANSISNDFQDALFLSADQTLDASDTLLATVPHVGSLAAGSLYAGHADVTLPAVTSGDYFVIVQTDRRYQVPHETNRANNVLTSLSPTTVTLPVLPLATPTASQFSSVGENHYYQVNVAAGQTLSVVVDSAAADGATELYVSRLHLPTPGDYDYAAVAFQPDQEVIVETTTAPGVYYVLACSRLSGATPGFTLTAKTVGFELTGIDHSLGENTGRVTLEIDGSRFTEATTFSLVSGGITIPAMSINFRDSGSLFATFDLTGRGAGSYDVVAVDGANSDTLPAAFQIVPSPGVSLVNPYLINVITPDALRQARQSSILIQYTNTSNVDQPAPLLEVVSNTRMRLEQQQVLVGDFNVDTGIDFLGIAPDGPAGILRPGQTGSQRVIFLTQPGEQGFTANFQVNVLDPGGTTAIDWSLYKSEMRSPAVPDDAWDAIFATFLTQVGTTTGDYVRLLGDNATYLSQLGIRTPDVSRLLGFEVQQASGAYAANDNPGVTDAALTASGADLVFARQFNNDIAGRYRMGPFGRGWSDNWDISATVDNAGNVILKGGGAFRYFTLQADGSYAGGTGEMGTLTLVSGAYRLQELGGAIQQFRSDGKISFVEDRNGNRISAAYDGSGRLQTLSTNAGGVNVALTYNAAGRISTLTDSNGGTVTYTYDVAGEQLIGYTDRYGSHVYSYVTGQGAQREHGLAEIAYSDGTHIRYAYDSQGRQIERKRDDDQERLTFDYDSAAGITVTAASGGSTTVLFNDAGRSELARNSLGQTTQYDYDLNNQLSRVVTPTGLIYSYQFCACGSPLSTTDPLGHTVTFKYEDPFRKLVEYTDAKGVATHYDYDSLGNLESITYADGSHQQGSYDSAGNLEEITNRRGHEIDIEYDTRGRVTSTTFADGTSQTFTYDSHDNLAKVTDASGDTIFTHDPVTDALTKISYPSGRFLEYTYNAINQRTQSTDQDGFIVNYHYDTLGRLDKLTDGTSALIVDYELDAAGRLVRRDNGNATFTTYQYDALGQLLTLINFASAGVVNSKFEYTYDAEGRRSTMTLTDSNLATADGTTTYGYDAIGQLVSVALPGGRTIAYSYDANGNRTQVADSQLGTTIYEVNNLNQIIRAGDTSFYYDPDGNLVRTSDPTDVTNYAYDDQNQLLSVDGPTGTFAYEYDAFGNRRASSQNGVRTEFLIDPTHLVNIAAEYGPGGALIAHYTDGLGLTSRVAANGSATYFDFDATGNTVGLTASNGGYVNRYTYLPFGETTTIQSTVSNRFQFVGQFGVQTAGDGLKLMHFRNYSSLTGQFVSDDPLNLSGGDTNLRAYVGNDPTNAIDPSGLQKIDIGKLCPNPLKLKLAPNPLDLTLKPAFDIRQEYDPEYKRDVDKLIKDLKAIDPSRLGSENYRDFKLKQLSGDFQKVLAPNKYGDPPNAGPGGSSGSGCTNPALPRPVPPQVGPRISGPMKGIPGVHALDPNDIIGPAGFGPQNFLAEDAPLPFVIDFENESAATAPAQEVFVTHTLNANLDLATFELGDVGFGPLMIHVPAGLQSYSTRVEFMNPDNSPLFVDFSAALNPATRVVTWILRSVDPATGELPEAALAGFLPPNDEQHRGEGFVEFVIRPLAGLTSGTAIRSVASIVFDTNSAIATNQLDPHNPAAGTDPDKEALVTIDAHAPTSQVTALPADTITETFAVAWSGIDEVRGSGLATYDLFVSDNGGSFTLWLDDTTAISSNYVGEFEHTYRFYSVATDNVGHVEAAPLTADTQTAVNIPINHAPSILDAVFSLTENSVLDTAVGSVVGTDVDLGDTLTYSIISGNSSGAFKIDSSTGAIAVANSARIDFESSPSFHLSIQVADNDGATDVASVTINITDVAEFSAIITLNSAPLVFHISGKGVAAIDSTATISNLSPPATSFDHSILKVSGHSAKDKLSILKQNDISTKGKNVLFGQTVIGTLSIGKKGAPLSVTLNGAATHDSVEKLLRSIGFKAAGKATGNRTLEFQITNLGGMNTSKATRQIQAIP